MAKPWKLSNIRGNVAKVTAAIDEAVLPAEWKAAIKSAIPAGAEAIELHAHCRCSDDAAPATNKPLPPRAKEFVLHVHIKPLF